MRAATMTRTNRTLYPDIFMVVDGRRSCESCDYQSRWSWAEMNIGCILVVTSTVEARV